MKKKEDDRAGLGRRIDDLPPEMLRRNLELALLSIKIRNIFIGLLIAIIFVLVFFLVL